MKAYYLVEFGDRPEVFQLREKTIPEPGPGEVLIKVRAFGLNFADVMARQGLYKECPPLPSVLGYDVEGEVVETGQGVSRFKSGDLVFGLTRFGGYATHAVANAEVVGHLSPEAPLGTGCALAVQGVTAFHAAEQVQTLMPGEKVLVHAAAGGLGTCLVQLAKARHCIVIGVAGGDAKMAYLKTLGVDHTIDRHQMNYVDYIKQHLDGKVDVVFDNVGGKSIPEAKRLLAPGGRIISLGAAAINEKKGVINLLRLATGFGIFSPITFLRNSQSLIGINMLRLADARPDIIRTAVVGTQERYAQNILKPHVGKVYPHEALAEAHLFMQQTGVIGKAVMKW